MFDRLIGDPTADGTDSPLINEGAYREMATALEEAQADGGELIVGVAGVGCGFPDAYYVEPAIVRMPAE